MAWRPSRVRSYHAADEPLARTAAVARRRVDDAHACVEREPQRVGVSVDAVRDARGTEPKRGSRAAAMARPLPRGAALSQDTSEPRHAVHWKLVPGATPTRCVTRLPGVTAFQHNKQTQRARLNQTW